MQISAFLANFQEKALIRKPTHKATIASSPTIVDPPACEVYLREIGVESNVNRLIADIYPISLLTKSVSKNPWLL